MLRLRNTSPNRHPIHLHGLVFRPLRSNKRTLPSNWTGTIVLDKEETIDIGLVTDNPGDWAFHCRAIEHQNGACRLCPCKLGERCGPQFPAVFCPLG